VEKQPIKVWIHLYFFTKNAQSKQTPKGRKFLPNLVTLKTAEKEDEANNAHRHANPIFAQTSKSKFSPRMVIPLICCLGFSEKIDLIIFGMANMVAF
jgi:hypothetical protein